MGGLTRSLFRLFHSFLPILEICILSFLLGVRFHSLSATIIILVILFISMFFIDVVGRMIGWGLLFYLHSLTDGQGDILFGIVSALIVAGIRYLIWKIIKI
ncbi:hypothetical protein EDD58_101600 [Hazenella coriacea]|uniref:Uncharacterized protein n=1 Tax=Hazenella coriacea TaxID=1179467 RepID=A0A4R3LAR5_9BACL|nr:hypothetical protein EDD58_101600 [Hazenella coriacea]